MKDKIVHKFSDIGRIVTGKTPPTKDKDNFIGNIPFITPRDMDNNRYIENTERNLSKKGVKTVRNSYLPSFSIMVSCIGSDMGKVAINKLPCVTNQQINSIILKDGVSYLYVYYNLLTRRNELKNLASSGSALPILNKNDFSNLEINLPPLETQQKIADILGSFDDKIELNRQMNQTLEAMAGAIFKSWFVDFDPVYAKMEGRDYPLPPETMDLFPEELEESELGLIPKGWKVVEIKSLGEIITGKTPSTKNKNYYDKREIPFIKIPDMHNKLFITETNDYLSKSGADSQKNKYLPPKSICVSCIATPGLTAMTTSFSQTNQQINSIVPHEKELANFILLTMKRKGDEIQNRGSGGSVLHNLNKGDFEKLLVILPENKLIGTFENYLNPVFSKILNNQIMNSCLEEIRNRLLVNLINF
jgi:type I restriction enzyme S subunit